MKKTVIVFVLLLVSVFIYEYSLKDSVGNSIPKTITKAVSDVSEPISKKIEEKDTQSQKLNEEVDQKDKEINSLTKKEFDKYFENMEFEETSAGSPFDNYKIVLDADENIFIPNPKARLSVWIGNEIYKILEIEGKVRAEADVAAVGEWAVVRPFSNDPSFEFKPKDTGCIKIDPTGSEVYFHMMPKNKGSFTVGASVDLYNEKNCKGTRIPKNSTELKVKVDVDKKEIVDEKINDLGSILWQSILDFWATLLTIVFGLILFLFKNKLKEKFGYEHNK